MTGNRATISCKRCYGGSGSVYDMNADAFKCRKLILDLELVSISITTISSATEFKIVTSPNTFEQLLPPSRSSLNIPQVDQHAVLHHRQRSPEHLLSRQRRTPRAPCLSSSLPTLHWLPDQFRHPPRRRRSKLGPQRLNLHQRSRWLLRLPARSQFPRRLPYHLFWRQRRQHLCDLRWY
jgi:hypothetical protein